MTGTAQRGIAAREFQGVFHTLPDRIVRAPGRLELLGNHTDYNQGLVLAATLDRFLTVAVAKRKDRQLRLHSESFPEADVVLRSSRDRTLPRGHWAGYVLALLRILEHNELSAGGWNLSITTSLPPGGGLSSSAALLVAAAIAIGHLPHRTQAQRLRIAQLCQAAEHQVGVPCGLLDYLAILHGKPGHAVRLDLRSCTVRTLRWPGRLALVVIDSGVRHQLAEGGYRRIEKACRGAARALGVDSLREATTADLHSPPPGSTRRLRADERGAALHVLSENQRVRCASQALAAGDARALGRLFSASHSSSRDRLHNSTPELDDWVARCASAPGWLGARLSGGGFGGMTVHLLRAARRAEFLKQLPAGTQAFAARLGGGVEVFLRRGGTTRSAYVLERK